MKLYTYTKKRSLPRLALKGLPEGSDLYGPDYLFSLIDSAYGDDEPNDPVTILEVDASGMTIRDVDLYGEWSHVMYDWGAKEEEIEALKTVEDVASYSGWLETLEPVPPGQITVLGEFPEDFGVSSEGIDSPEDLAKVLVGKPRPLKSFKQPLVTRLLRSIFLPKHKLYGAGRSAVMGSRLVEVFR
jgi:hypothetical protein